MSIVVPVLLTCTAVAAAIAARISFRLAYAEGASRGVAWAVAGGTVGATIVDVCTVASALGLPHGSPSSVRLGVTIIWVVLALGVAYVAYDVTGPAIPAPAAGPTGGLSRAKRWGTAAGGFTGTIVVLNAILQLI
ncbi:hypothetical protein ACFY5F_29300 [Streptomyces sp. NPDC013161]|uniref:hypothetical protein n=1 Tax=Streptomyces sp. NPDC013161 TaxID=3364862 RepID=UPI003682C074